VTLLQGIALAEARALWEAVRDRLFLPLVLLFFLLYALVLQGPFVFNLDVGAGLEPPAMNSFDHLLGRTFGERVGRPLDLVYLDHFYAEEHGADFTFRWSEPQSRIQVGGLARGPLLLRLRMHGIPAGPVTRTRLVVGGQPLAEFPVEYPLHEYSFVLDPGTWSGDVLSVGLESTSFRPGGEDTRNLGIALDRVDLIGWEWGRRPFLPPTALLLAGTVLFLYLGLRRAGLGTVAVGGVAFLWGLVLLVGLLLPARPFVAAYAPGLFLATALAYPVLLLTLRLAEVLLRRAPQPPDRRAWRWLGVLFLLVFLLRFGGALSPRYASHDAPFHANRLEFAERGALFFEHVSVEAEMRNDPYPGAFYLSVLPLTLLVQDRLGLLAFFVAWAASSEVFLLWFLARQVLGKRASRWATLLYAAFPINLAAYWAGIYTNLFASWVVLLVAVAVVLAWQRRLTGSLLLWVPLFALLFLAHFGLVILWIPVTLLWGVLLYREGDRLQRARLRRLLLAWLLGLVLAVTLYYSYFLAFFGSTVAAVGSSLQGTISSGGEETPRLVRTLAELRVWWDWGALVDYAGIGLFLGGLGLLTACRRKGAVSSLLWSMATIALLFWAVSMLAFYFTRYMLFLLPVVAIGSAAVLSACWRRGPAGRSVALVGLFYVCAMTVAMWVGLCLFGLRPPHVL
jgi:hypothetical protein